MNPIAAITQIGSLVGTVRSLVSSHRNSSVAASQPQTFEASMQDALTRFLQTKDADRDGSLSVKEFGGSRRDFAALDTNHDGRLSRAELMPLFAPPASGK